MYKLSFKSIVVKSTVRLYFFWYLRRKLNISSFSLSLKYINILSSNSTSGLLSIAIASWANTFSFIVKSFIFLLRIADCYRATKWGIEILCWLKDIVIFLKRFSSVCRFF